MDLVRPLGLAGIGCAVVAQSGTQPLFSRFTRTALPWDGNFWDAGDDLLEVLIEFGLAQLEPPVLFYQQDSQTLLISRNRARLGRAFRFVMPDEALVETFVDKDRFQALATSKRLPAPNACRIYPAGDTVPANLDLRFPVVIKPLTRSASWRALGDDAKALTAETLEDLRAIWPQLATAGIELLVQEAVFGPESAIESYHVYADQAGGVVAEFTGKKIRTLPAAFGRSTAVTITDAPEVAALGRDLVRSLNFTGVAKFDFKRAPDGTLYLLEINPRFNLWHHLGAVAGVNIPALVYADLVGLPRPAVTRARAGVSWCQPNRDWHAAKTSGVAFAAWLRWALRCEAKTVFADDPLPYLIPLISRSKLLKRLSARLGPTTMPASATNHERGRV